MNKSIFFTLSIAIATIAPSIVNPAIVLAQEPIAQSRCMMESPVSQPEAMESQDSPVGTVKDLQLGVQKVELRCFFGDGSGERIEGTFQIPGTQFPADPFLFTIESGKIKVPVFQITF